VPSGSASPPWRGGTSASTRPPPAPSSPALLVSVVSDSPATTIHEGHEEHEECLMKSNPSSISFELFVSFVSFVDHLCRLPERLRSQRVRYREHPRAGADDQLLTGRIDRHVTDDTRHGNR